LSLHHFGRSKRLITAADYRYVFQNAQRSTDNHFVVLARATQAGASRLGLAIAKKHVKRAVDRNRIKRIAREAFRLHCPAEPGLDLVVMARSDTAKHDSATLHKALLKHWQKLSRN
jgi:ribonuclease P protein component